MEETQLFTEPPPASEQERRNSLTSSPFLPISLYHFLLLAEPKKPRSLRNVTQSRAGKGQRLDLGAANRPATSSGPHGAAVRFK